MPLRPSSSTGHSLGLHVILASMDVEEICALIHWKWFSFTAHAWHLHNTKPSLSLAMNSLRAS